MLLQTQVSVTSAKDTSGEYLKLLYSAFLLSFTLGVRSTGFLYGVFYLFYFIYRFPWSLYFKQNQAFLLNLVCYFIIFLNNFLLNSLRKKLFLCFYGWAFVE